VVGEFKDDCLQRLRGYFSLGASMGASYGIGPVSANGVFQGGSDYGTRYQVSQVQIAGGAIVYFDSLNVARSGTTTHGKQKGVKYIIKVL
jgi:hypothetical protein